MRTVRRILISGDRLWNCPDLAERIVNRLVARYGFDLVIVHGGANGVDEAFAEACRNLGIAAEPHVADWRGLGNIAGPARNREMVQAGADLCVALHRNLAESKGTKDCPWGQTNFQFSSTGLSLTFILGVRPFFNLVAQV